MVMIASMFSTISALAVKPSLSRPTLQKERLFLFKAQVPKKPAQALKLVAVGGPPVHALASPLAEQYRFPLVLIIATCILIALIVIFATCFFGIGGKQSSDKRSCKSKSDMHPDLIASMGSSCLSKPVAKTPRYVPSYCIKEGPITCPLPASPSKGLSGRPTPSGRRAYLDQAASGLLTASLCTIATDPVTKGNVQPTADTPPVKDYVTLPVLPSPVVKTGQPTPSVHPDFRTRTTKFDYDTHFTC